jgi:hypothetical protein
VRVAWSSVDLDERTFWIRHAVARLVSGELIEKDPKSHQTRLVSIDPTTCQVLRDHRDDQMSTRAMADGIDQTGRVGQPESFEWSRRKNGDVVITHHGRIATTLRGRSADDFVAGAGDGQAQELMARLTGNYKRGNERNAKKHPRNRGR